MLRLDLAVQTDIGATAPPIRLQALFLCPHSRVMAGCAGTPSGVPGPISLVRQPCAIRHPYSVWRQKVMAQIDIGVRSMTTLNRYMPITGHDCNIPSLLIDTQAPIDVLHDAAAYRIRAVTQLLENFATSDDAPKDAVVLQELSLVCSILLRDGCDLMDVAGRRMQGQLSA